MKKFYSLIYVILGLALVNCAPSAKQLKEAIEKDPSIVFVAIEKDPDKFIEVVNKAAREAQKKAQEKAMAEANTKRDDEFKNPLKPEIDEARVIFGNKSAKVTIVEYSDFECYYCSKAHATVKQLLKDYPNDVRIVYKHLPIDDIHPHATLSAKYFEAVAKQSHDKALKFHDLLFENQKTLQAKGETYLKEAAKKVGADVNKIGKDLNDESIMKRIIADTEEARKFEFSGTPGFLINGVSLRGAYPIEEFKKIIDTHLKQ